MYVIETMLPDVAHKYYVRHMYQNFKVTYFSLVFKETKLGLYNDNYSSIV